MKTKTLLAALALPALFAACSQDEFVTTQESEFQGTPIGYLEFTATRDVADTRLNLNGWQENDKIALGWISADNLTAGADLFSNHPLFFKGNSSFKSETMVFEGLYIASFPYQETKKISPLAFDLKKQTSTTLEEAYGKRVYVSDKFVNLKGEAAGMGNATALKMVPLTNLMKLNIKLAKDAKVPEDFKVLGVKLAGTTLVDSLCLKSNLTSDIATNGESTVANVYWNPICGKTGTGEIAVQVGAANVGTAIDATNGLDVYVQLGALKTADASTLTIVTNYGDASIVEETDKVTWSSTGLGQKDDAKVASFKAALGAIATKAGTKVYGYNASVNVTLDAESIKVPTVVTCQADLDRIVTLLDKLGAFADGKSINQTIEFSKSTLKAENKVVETDGDVVITDISGLNKLGGTVTFEKDATAPTHVYIAGELGLAKTPTITNVNFEVLDGSTLTVTKNLSLGSAGITVKAGGKLVNKAKITATGTIKISEEDNTDKENVIPAAIYESNGSAAIDVTGGTFTNSGVAHWIAGSLKNVGGKIYADVTTGEELNNADAAFGAATSATEKEVKIDANMTVAGQLQSTTFANITKMTINGNVAFGVNQANAFNFSELAAINVETGSFSLTGGDTAEGEDKFYAFVAAAGCTLTLAKDTKLDIPAGAKLDLSATGSVVYNSAKVNNAGYIVAQSSTGTGTWEGNAVNENPKEEK